MIFQEDVEPRDFTYYYLSQTRGLLSADWVASSNAQLAQFGEIRKYLLIDASGKRGWKRTAIFIFEKSSYNGTFNNSLIFGDLLNFMHI